MVLLPPPLHEAAEDSQWRSFVVLYAGDFDPSGMYMSEKDLPERLERYDADIEIRRIALLPRDIDGLPHFDLGSKGSDARHGWYLQHYGNRCWELDAMSPVHLRDRVETAILSYIDPAAWELAQSRGGRDRHHRQRARSLAVGYFGT